jgi:hypothetical protein
VVLDRQGNPVRSELGRITQRKLDGWVAPLL